MRNEYPITAIAPTGSAILGLLAPAAAGAPALQEIVVDLSACARVAALVPDALGEFPFQMWRHEMPFLDSLHRRRSLILRSIMPSITPVNFTAMVTGAAADVHGIQTRDDDIRCESLFDVVRRAGGRSAGIGQNGYTGAELLGRHADICGRGRVTMKDDAVERLIVEIVDRDCPEFLIAQLGTTDDRLHEFGPSSPDVVPIFRETDRRLQRLCAHLLMEGYGIIILADHGQHDVDDPQPPGYLRGMHGSDSDKDCLVPCTWLPADMGR
jgi:predicted AlkP superfamily pyrophosphatase or phosphodiesterase